MVQKYPESLREIVGPDFSIVGSMSLYQKDDCGCTVWCAGPFGRPFSERKIVNFTAVSNGTPLHLICN